MPVLVRVWFNIPTMGAGLRAVPDSKGARASADAAQRKIQAMGAGVGADTK